MVVFRLILRLLVFVLWSGPRSLWDRYRADRIPDYLLETPDLEIICAEYLDLIRRMQSGLFDRETIHLLDSERQTTHDEILLRLGFDRSSHLDVELFARIYLGRG